MWPLTVRNKCRERDMPFQIKRGVVTYSEAVQQKKSVAIIWDSMLKLINLRESKRRVRRDDD